ncbi:class I SAM-dependent methyltransferase [Blastococcus sp. VKM Ac-2987]|uniref:class I SAM-dependent methyltransferase n=1 Tax=Blastococcus sp. VKM Ac-2987 TaxID=3004141 RepID=UPI0022AB8E75|nr:class I SAM-dependent methyltransferase [Blastococcus sp. VKM Ac-2987]MCZ2860384.1 class I SAM-dependent methyltransferase [Blastococcus sp. VKM Ac-2987]
MQLSTITGRVVRHARTRGAGPVLADCASWGARWLAGRARAGRPSTATFEVDGTAHAYLRHPYNYTWLNERAVEVPLAAAVLAGAGPGARVLEVGNVLAHYRPVDHAVVDKYERAPGVRNVDVVDIDLPGPFDLVLAVSTLEHVGLDEAVQDPGKPARAIAHLRSLLAPGGRLWCTIPAGYNPALDERLHTDGLGATRLTALRRTGRDNRWEQVPLAQVRDVPYDWLLYTAHAVVVAEFGR